MSSSSKSRHDKDRTRDKRDEKHGNNGDHADSGEENVAEGMEFSVNSSGEISATIEQTNRIRAKLGLKPLKIENKEETERKQREEVCCFVLFQLRVIVDWICGPGKSVFCLL